MRDDDLRCATLLSIYLYQAQKSESQISSDLTSEICIALAVNHLRDEVNPKTQGPYEVRGILRLVSHVGYPYSPPATEIMADTFWTEGISNETVANASSDFNLEADFQYPLFTVIYSIVFVLGLTENVLALYLLSCKVKHISHSYVYMINLAMVDTLFVCVLPFKIHYHLNQNNWIFGDMACRLTGTLYYINIYLSIAFFTCICVDRYIAVLHPFTYIQIKVTHYVMVVTILWMVAVSVMVPLILGGPLHNDVGNKTACFENFATSSWTYRMASYNILALVFGFVIPFSIILITYPLIAKRISQIKHSIRKRKALRTIYIVLFICTFCFLPYHLTHLLHFLMRIQVIQNEPFTNLIYKMRRVTLALVSFNCCFNPLLYYFTSSSKQWHFNFKLRFRSKIVYTICDQKFGDYSYTYFYKLEQRHGNKNHGDGIN
ncbi:lysophosphatidic acid receptor 6-like isoform X3 [Apteryx mantelli]|uniref:Lysophosphatidic acid receptor 6-like isoform X3 n=1 Tax=Apteryx mantelli TaxID=2696672 RepID=A0A8B7JKE3_9AVES|nr:PREDICTED: lysophosphatidic acid receptor 6-like isoform X3 [Apteryx mantelli mantelli]XP_025929913.1 tRNA pseudouridine synthase-like 1 isoform X1 [Apteryx rowi]